MLRKQLQTKNVQIPGAAAVVHASTALACKLRHTKQGILETLLMKVKLLLT